MFSWTFTKIKVQGHSLTFIEDHSASTFSIFFSLETASQLKPNFICSLQTMREWKWAQMIYVAWPRWLPCPFMVKIFKKVFSGTERPKTLKLGMQHWILKYMYRQFCSNEAPGLTLTYFTARSILVPYAFVWEKVKTKDFPMVVL